MIESHGHISRREFLKLSGAAIAGAVIPKGVLGFVAPERGGITQEEIDFLRHHEVSMGDKNRNVVLMTYDDGGTPENISDILDAFKQVKGKTTFFVTGDWLEKQANKETTQRIVSEGHVLGCHGYHHDPFTSLSTEKMNEQLSKFIEVVDQVVPGYRVRFFRPPYGDRNQSVREEAAKLGMQTVMWSLSSGGQDIGTYQRVVNGAKRGAIVLSHSTRHYDVNQASKIVTGLVDLGYSLENMDTGLDPKDYWKKQPDRVTESREYYMRKMPDRSILFTEKIELLTKNIGEMVKPELIIIHWDGNPGDQTKWVTATTRNGLIGNETSANFAVGIDGVLQLTKMEAEKITSTHGATGRDSAINIEFAGNQFDKTPPPETEIKKRR